MARYRITALLTAGSEWSRIWQTGITFNTGNCAEVFVNSAEIIVSHVLKLRPRHDLKEWSKLRVRMIRINARPYNLHKLFKA